MLNLDNKIIVNAENLAFAFLQVARHLSQYKGRKLNTPRVLTIDGEEIKAGNKKN